MAKTPSKSKKKQRNLNTPKKSKKVVKQPAKQTVATPEKKGIKQRFQNLRKKWQDFHKGHKKYHKSFHRSYREDYLRKTDTPGLLSHAVTTFQFVFKHWKTFFALIAVMVIAYVVLVGIMSEDLYLQFQDSIDATSAQLANGDIGNFAKAALLLLSTVTSGGLNTSMGEAQMVFMFFLFLVMWLVTIYLTRHFMAGGRPKMRDALYNALSPLISTLVVFVIIFIQAIPIMLMVIAYYAAVTTDFLNTPLYALAFFIFASIMIIISVYLLSSSIMGLIIVTTPGTYPLNALYSASDLMAGRRTKFIIRIVYMLIVVAFIYAVVMTPIIMLDLFLKSVWEIIYGIPIVPFFLVATTCFCFIYGAVYLYRYYRWVLDSSD